MQLWYGLLFQTSFSLVVYQVSWEMLRKFNRWQVWNNYFTICEGLYYIITSFWSVIMAVRILKSRVLSVIPNLLTTSHLRVGFTATSITQDVSRTLPLSRETSPTSSWLICGTLLLEPWFAILPQVRGPPKRHGVSLWTAERKCWLTIFKHIGYDGERSGS